MPSLSLSRLVAVLLCLWAFGAAGCSYIPWIGDDESEEDLAFEQEFGEPDEPASEEGISQDEDSFFADEPSESFDESGFGEADAGGGMDSGGSEGFETAPQGGFAGVQQGTTANELKTDVETLQAQQEALITRVRELQEIIQTMEPRLAATQSRVDNLGSNPGGGESLQPEIERLKAEVARLNQEISRLKAQEGKMRTAAAAPAKPRRTARRGSRLPRAYTQALDAYRKGDYDDSIVRFQEFAEKGNPPENLKDNIHFWLGSSYFKLDMYDEAINHFQSVIEKYPRGNKVHDARYMLGLTLFKKGDRGRALDVLETALKTNPPPEVRNKIERQLMEIQ